MPNLGEVDEEDQSVVDDLAESWAKEADEDARERVPLQAGPNQDCRPRRRLRGPGPPAPLPGVAGQLRRRRRRPSPPRDCPGVQRAGGPTTSR